MNKREEKQWLRSILEREVKPGDEAWEQIRNDKEFERIRQSIRKRASLHLEDNKSELNAMWQIIERHLSDNDNHTGINKKQKSMVWTSWVAVVVLLISLPFIYLDREPQEIPQEFLTAAFSQQRIVLVMPDGERKTLNEQNEQVVVNEDGGMRTSARTLIVESGSKKRKEPEYYTLDVPKGTEYNLVLPDGTKVFLNAGTTLRYPDCFVGATREIILSGEAYFMVAKDAEHPFIVKTGDVNVQVLGTIFNINAYPDGEWIRTTLVEGKVKTECNHQNIVMEPGTQVAYNKSLQLVDYKPVDVSLYTSWIEGYYDFEEMELGELMQIISRWYDIPIDFASPDLKKIKFSGRLQRYESAEQLFKMLRYIREITFEIIDHRIIIQTKQRK